eukprot:6211827-Pleurochrysis_carterae.AAC.1
MDDDSSDVLAELEQNADVSDKKESDSYDPADEDDTVPLEEQVDYGEVESSSPASKAWSVTTRQARLAYLALPEGQINAEVPVPSPAADPGASASAADVPEYTVKRVA